jgi:hypothetical protein
MRAWLVAVVALTACKDASKAPSLVSTLKASDLAHASQFAAGFYDVEESSWRWTGKQFIAVLARPEDAAGRAVSLSISFTAAESIFKNNPSIKVTCAVDGQALEPETYTALGPYVMTRPLGKPLSSRSAQVYCEVDHVTRVQGDQRELGIIVTSLELI